jgi:septal ring factor EnvC (AmiA/AmiB activator)
VTAAARRHDGDGERTPAARRRAALAAVAVAVLAGAALVVHDWAATVDSTERADARLDETRAALGRTDRDLADARHSSDAQWAVLETKVDALGTRQAERSEAQRTFDATSRWLAALEDQLATATSRHEASEQRLQSLQACLVGVTKALNQAAVGDADGLSATVRSIEGPCAAAGVHL